MAVARRAVVLLIGALAIPWSSALAAAPFSSDTGLSDGELGAQHAMFRTPDGLEIALGVQMDTRIAGTLVLRSVFTATAALGEKLRIFSQSTNAQGPVKQSTGAMEPLAQQPVSVAFDRSSGLPVADIGSSVVPVRVNINPTATLAGQETDLVPIQPDATGMATSAFGPVQVQVSPTNMSVSLMTDATLVKHVLGNTTANIIANTANNAMIDTVTTVNLSMSGTLPLVLGNSLVHLGDIGLPVGVRSGY